MKNWEPLVPGPALAMESVKGRSCRRLLLNSSSNSVPQMLCPPVPFPAVTGYCMISQMSTGKRTQRSCRSTQEICALASAAAAAAAAACKGLCEHVQCLVPAASLRPRHTCDICSSGDAPCDAFSMPKDQLRPMLLVAPPNNNSKHAMCVSTILTPWSSFSLLPCKVLNVHGLRTMPDGL